MAIKPSCKLGIPFHTDLNYDGSRNEILPGLDTAQIHRQWQCKAVVYLESRTYGRTMNPGWLGALFIKNE